MMSIFDPAGVSHFVARVERLRPDSTARWGRMNAAQMLAHNSLIFESVLTGHYPRMNPVMRWIAARLIRGFVLGNRPYRRNSPTAPDWVVSDGRDLVTEQARIVTNLRAVHALGRSHFKGKANPTFGVLSADEWNTLFLKHLDHHLEQFGV